MSGAESSPMTDTCHALVEERAPEAALCLSFLSHVVTRPETSAVAARLAAGDRAEIDDLVRLRGPVGAPQRR